MGVDWTQRIRQVKEIVLNSVSKATKQEIPVDYDKLVSVLVLEYEFSRKRARRLLDDLINASALSVDSKGFLWCMGGHTHLAEFTS